MKRAIFNFMSNSYSQFYSPVQQTFVQTHPNLDSFRQPLLNGHSHVIYTKKKAEVKLYQGIFWGLGLLFFMLAALVYSKNPNWTCNVLFADGALVKTFIYSFSFILAGSAFVVGYFLRPECDTIHFMTHKVEKYLKNFYKRQQAEINWFYSLYGDGYARKVSFRQGYYHTMDKIRESKESTLRLLDKIAHSSYDFEYKEKLFNQAIFELQEELNVILQSFKQNHAVLIESK